MRIGKHRDQTVFELLEEAKASYIQIRKIDAGICSEDTFLNEKFKKMYEKMHELWKEEGDYECKKNK